MSSNTNTLFWVITGAVIVLAIFGLVNNFNSIDRAFSSIKGNVDNAIAGTSDDLIIDVTEDLTKYDRTNANKNNDFVYLNDKDFLLAVNVLNDSEVEWTITNYSGKADKNRDYILQVYDSVTNQLVNECYFSAPLNIGVNNSTKITTNYGTNSGMLNDHQYYKLVIR